MYLTAIVLVVASNLSIRIPKIMGLLQLKYNDMGVDRSSAAAIAAAGAPD